MAGGETKTDDEGFLGRWSRRKAEARTEEKTATPGPADLDEERASDVVPGEAEADHQSPGVDLDSLPDIESLGPTSDFSVFMRAGVPADLRMKALRKLWRMKPELANLDGLVDYGEDLTGSFKVVDHLKTAYQVGRGFLKSDEGPAPAETDEAVPVSEDVAEAIEGPAADEADPTTTDERSSKTEQVEKQST